MIDPTLFYHRYYLRMNPDVEKEIGTDSKDVLNHYLQLGIFEGRSPNPFFFPQYYESVHVDLKKAMQDDRRQLFIHWQKHGLEEGRSASPIFDPTFYISSYPDLAGAFKTNKEAYDHYFRYGIKEGRLAVRNLGVLVIDRNYRIHGAAARIMPGKIARNILQKLQIFTNLANFA